MTRFEKMTSLTVQPFHTAMRNPRLALRITELVSITWWMSDQVSQPITKADDEDVNRQFVTVTFSTGAPPLRVFREMQSSAVTRTQPEINTFFEETKSIPSELEALSRSE